MNRTVQTTRQTTEVHSCETMPDSILKDDAKAEAAWLEVENGETYLCMDLDDGQTVSVELDGRAIHSLGDDLRHGPRKLRS